jgi:hypothetical protein
LNCGRTAASQEMLNSTLPSFPGPAAACSCCAAAGTARHIEASNITHALLIFSPAFGCSEMTIDGDCTADWASRHPHFLPAFRRPILRAQSYNGMDASDLLIAPPSDQLQSRRYIAHRTGKNALEGLGRTQEGVCFQVPGGQNGNSVPDRREVLPTG